jgi:ribonuclease HI
MIEIFSDGASRGNPGPGGYGVILKSGKHYKELSGGFAYTTNNRMELMAVIKGLEAIKLQKADVCVYTDSSYICNAINHGWLFKWEKNNFEKKMNADLWKKFLPLYRKHNVKFIWIKGHAGHPENERCDRLAVEASMNQDLPVDTGYVSLPECNPDSLTTDQNRLL